MNLLDTPSLVNPSLCMCMPVFVCVFINVCVVSKYMSGHSQQNEVLIYHNLVIIYGSNLTQAVTSAVLLAVLLSPLSVFVSIKQNN